MAKFGKTSNERLGTCSYILQSLFEKVVEKYDCTILQGHRSMEEQEHLYKIGQSRVRVGRHNHYPSLAVDVAPWPIPDNWGEDNTLEKAKFYHFAGYVKGVADEMGVAIRWGGDWDGDLDFDDQSFMDLVHFEIKLEK